MVNWSSGPGRVACSELVAAGSCRGQLATTGSSAVDPSGLSRGQEGAAHTAQGHSRAGFSRSRAASSPAGSALAEPPQPPPCRGGWVVCGTPARGGLSAGVNSEPQRLVH